MREGEHSFGLIYLYFECEHLELIWRGGGRVQINTHYYNNV